VAADRTPGQRDSLEARVVGPLLGVLWVLALVPLFTTVRLLETSLDEQLRQRAVATTNMVASRVERVRGEGELQQLVTSLGASRDIDHLVVLDDETHIVVASSHHADLGRPVSELPEGRTVVMDGALHLPGGEPVEIRSVLLPNPQGVLPKKGRAIVVLDSRSSDLAVQSLFRKSIFSTLMVTFLAAAGLWFVVRRRVTGRVDALAAVIRARAGGDTSVRIQPEGTDALAVVGEELNRLMDRLDALDAERTAREQQLARMAQIAARTSNLVVLTDPRGRITWVNHAFERQTGWSLEDVQGRRPSEVVHGPETDREVVAYMRTALRAGEGFRAEVQNYRRDGSSYWVELEVLPVPGPDGSVQEFMAVETDITDARASRARLEQALETAEAAARARGDFLAVMSHEIRTPLNGVLGNVELLLTDDLTPEQAAKVQTIGSCGELLLTLMTDVLDFARLDAGRLQLESVPASPAAVVHDVVAMFRPSAAEKGLLVDVLVASELPGQVMGDPTALRQVAWNLVSNAVKFTESGSVKVELSGFPVDAEDRVGLRLEVSDTGPGMTEEELSRLFRPFEQADNSTRRRFGGTGLGMSIAHRLVDLMGGTISVDSVVGEGTNIRVEGVFLRAADVPEPASAGPVEVVSVPEALDVLVVDDNPVNLAVAGQMLDRLGCRTTRVNSGAAAIAATESQTFHLVLMDCQMPEMDGYEAVERIRAEEVRAGRQRATVFALTADATAGVRERCTEAGMDGYLSKPVRLGQLREVLGRAAATRV
jgi:PAS domain S-box-containing protein